MRSKWYYLENFNEPNRTIELGERDDLEDVLFIALSKLGWKLRSRKSDWYRDNEDNDEHSS